jgi:hypothetical protein
MRSQESVKGRGDSFLSIAYECKSALEEAHGESDVELLLLQLHRSIQKLGSCCWTAANGSPRCLACATPPRPTGYCRVCAVMSAACASIVFHELHLACEVAMEAPPLASLSLTHVNYVRPVH